MPPIGGGSGYDRIYEAAHADYVVGSLSGLEQALSEASRNEVVFVNDEIDMGEAELTVPVGVTLASDRGKGNQGALVTDGNPWWMLTVKTDARVTGLEIGGPKWDWVDIDADGELAIDVQGGNVEIDNCDLYGFGYAAVRVDDDTHVHHNHIHHNPKDGTGYGVSCGGAANPLIEWNVFDHNRHSIAASGSGGYTARYNYVGEGAISHCFDMHKPGGTRIEIYENTFTPVQNAWKDKKVPGVCIRGVPDDVAEIHHNHFHNPEEPLDTPADYWSDEAIVQMHVNDWQNIDMHDNHYGDSEPPEGVGVPATDGGTELDHTVTITTHEEGELDYVLTIEGGPVRKAGQDPLAAEDNDEIIETEDGVFDIDGYTGNEGFGDTFEYNGQITNFESIVSDAAFTIEVDGEEVGTDFPLDGGGEDDSGDDGSTDPEPEPEPEPEPGEAFTVVLNTGEGETEVTATLDESDDGYSINVDMPDDFGGTPSGLSEQVDTNTEEVEELRSEIEALKEDVSEAQSFISKLRGLFS